MCSCSLESMTQVYMDLGNPLDVNQDVCAQCSCMRNPGQQQLAREACTRARHLVAERCARIAKRCARRWQDVQEGVEEAWRQKAGAWYMHTCLEYNLN